MSVANHFLVLIRLPLVQTIGTAEVPSILIVLVSLAPALLPYLVA